MPFSKVNSRWTTVREAFPTRPPLMDLSLEHTPRGGNGPRKKVGHGWKIDERRKRTGTTNNSRQKLHPWVHSFIRKASIKVSNVENISHLGHVSRRKFIWHTHWSSGNACQLPGKANCAVVLMIYFWAICSSFVSDAGIKHHSQGSLKKALFRLMILEG